MLKVQPWVHDLKSLILKVSPHSPNKETLLHGHDVEIKYDDIHEIFAIVAGEQVVL